MSGVEKLLRLGRNTFAAGEHELISGVDINRDIELFGKGSGVAGVVNVAVGKHDSLIVQVML